MEYPALVFALTNLGIFLGYMRFGVGVAPQLNVSLYTRVAGVIFFTTCGLTHLEMMLHSLDSVDRWATNEELHNHFFTMHHMQIIHAIQVIAVWCFAHGFTRDLKRAREAKANPLGAL